MTFRTCFASVRCAALVLIFSSTPVRSDDEPATRAVPRDEVRQAAVQFMKAVEEGDVQEAKKIYSGSKDVEALATAFGEAREANRLVGEAILKRFPDADMPANDSVTISLTKDIQRGRVTYDEADSARATVDGPHGPMVRLKKEDGAWKVVDVVGFETMQKAGRLITRLAEEMRQELEAGKFADLESVQLAAATRAAAILSELYSSPQTQPAQPRR